MYTCRSCNYNFTEEQGDRYKSGLHLRLDCPRCHHFIKFLVQCVNPGGVIMPFGKYKGLRIDEIHIQDTDYFRWMCEKLESPFYKDKAKEYLRNVQAPTRPVDFEPEKMKPERKQDGVRQDDGQQKLDL